MAIKIQIKHYNTANGSNNFTNAVFCYKNTHCSRNSVKFLYSVKTKSELIFLQLFQSRLPEFLQSFRFLKNRAVGPRQYTVQIMFYGFCV